MKKAAYIREILCVLDWLGRMMSGAMPSAGMIWM